MGTYNKTFLMEDIAIIGFSLIIAAILVRTDIFINILDSSQGLEIIGSFIAGIFFTSIFTTAPATVTLAELAQTNSIWLVSLFGAIGAVTGDMLIFRFVKDRFSAHLAELLRHHGLFRRLKVTFRHKSFRWLTLLIGALVIVSPIPDEIGISLLGLTRMKLSWFIVLSFVFNFIGILVVGSVGQALMR